jgi:hypothetical protein
MRKTASKQVACLWLIVTLSIVPLLALADVPAGFGTCDAGGCVPATEYKGDGDPTTLEKTQRQLILRAFEIRIARASSGL